MLLRKAQEVQLQLREQLNHKYLNNCTVYTHACMHTHILRTHMYTLYTHTNIHTQTCNTHTHIRMHAFIMHIIVNTVQRLILKFGGRILKL